MEYQVLFINDPFEIVDRFKSNTHNFTIKKPNRIQDWIMSIPENIRLISNPIISICFSDDKPHDFRSSCNDSECFICLTKQISSLGIETLGILRSQHTISNNLPFEAQKLQVLRLDNFKEQNSINQLKNTIKSILKINLHTNDKSLFITYSNKDSSEFVHQFYSELINEGFLPFLDKRDLDPGDEWQTELEETLSRNNLVLYIESTNSGQSNWVNIELNTARQLAIPIFIIQRGEISEIDRNDISKSLEVKKYKNDENALTIVKNIKSDLLSSISNHLFKLRKIKTGLFYLPHHSCTEINLTKLNQRNKYLLFIKSSQPNSSEKTSKNLVRWFHPVLRSSDIESFSQNIEINKEALPAHDCLAILYSELPRSHTSSGKRRKDLIREFSRKFNIELYEVNQVDRLRCDNFMYSQVKVNLPTFKDLLRNKKVFLSASFGKILSGSIDNIDANEASYLIKQVVRLVLTNEGILIFGGHPSVSNIIFNMASRQYDPMFTNLKLFQSKFFENKIPNYLLSDLDWKNRIHWTPKDKANDMEKSLAIMRHKMLKNIDIAFFIGGGLGIKDESDLVRSFNPSCLRVYLSGAGGYSNKIVVDNNLQLVNLFSDKEIEQKIQSSNIKDFNMNPFSNETFRRILYFS